jgi:ADP-heptose:LPS heptosyltransferase
MLSGLYQSMYRMLILPLRHARDFLRMPRSRRRRLWRYHTRGLRKYLHGVWPRIWLCLDQPGIKPGTLAIASGITDVCGWALASRGIAAISVSCDGRPVGKAGYGIRRPDVVKVGLGLRGTLWSGFLTHLNTLKLPDGLHTVTVTAHSTDGRSRSVSRTFKVKNAQTPYDRWRLQHRLSAAALDWMRRASLALAYQPRISLILLLRSDADLRLLRATLQSLSAQAYPDWELCLACEETLHRAAAQQIAQLLGQEQRVRLEIDDLDDTAAARNLLVRIASGELVGLIDPGDVLEAHALFEIVYLWNRRLECDLVYSDEDVVSDLNERSAPSFKPDGSSDLPPSSNTIGRLWLARKSLIEEVGGFRTEFLAAGEDDLLLRVTERAQEIGHVRAVLYGKYRPGRAGSTADEAIDEEPTLLTHSPCPLIERETIDKILVIKLDHLGDVLLTLPAIRRLRDLFPEAEITALVGSWARTLMEREPCVDRVLTYDLYHASSSRPPRVLMANDRQAVWELLAPHGFDLAIDFRREVNTRDFVRLSGARYMVGFAHDQECPWLTVAVPWDPYVPRRQPRRHLAYDAIRVVEMLALACQADLVPAVTATAEEHEWVRQLLGAVLPDASGPVVGIHPGAGRDLKRWPAERFALLADLAQERLGATVVLFAGPGEEALAESILEQIRGRADVISLAGRLTIGQFVAALPYFDLFVGNDSGPTHLAGAAGIPTLGIYSGMIEASQWAPLGRNAAAIHRGMLCAPCYVSEARQCPYQLACLEKISVEAVWEAAVRMLLPARKRRRGGDLPPETGQDSSLTLPRLESIRESNEPRA